MGIVPGRRIRCPARVPWRVAPWGTAQNDRHLREICTGPCRDFLCAGGRASRESPGRALAGARRAAGESRSPGSLREQGGRGRLWRDFWEGISGGQASEITNGPSFVTDGEDSSCGRSPGDRIPLSLRPSFSCRRMSWNKRSLRPDRSHGQGKKA